MQITKKFILKTIISSLLVLSTTSVAETQYAGTTPFVSGQSLKKGFFWYNDKEPVEEEEQQDQQPLSGSPSHNQNEELKLDSRWLKENLLNLRFAAMDNPTDENLSRYYTANRLMMDIATRFSDRTRDYFINNPMMSEKRRQPTETVALNAHRAGLEENQQKALSSIFQKSGLFFFFQSTCQYCHEQSQILNFMQNYYHIDIMPVSIDGRPLHNGIFPRYGRATMEMIKQYAITEVPTVYLMSNDGSQATIVSTGLVSAEELKNTIILAARGMNLLDEASFQNTLDIKKQYVLGDRDVLTVNKMSYEQDPYLLQNIMDKKLSEYDMPTTYKVDAGITANEGGYSGYLH